MSASTAQSIVDYILGEQASGRLKSGARIPSRPALMERFGCARVTVDSAVRMLEQDGIVESVRGRGTFLKAKVKSRSGKVKPLIVVPAMTELAPENYFVHGLFLGLLQGLAAQEYDVVDVAHLRGKNSPAAIAQRLKRERRALFCITPGWEIQPILDACMQADVPACCVLRDYEPAHAVTVDNVAGVGLAIQHLAAHGHKRFGFVGLGQGNQGGHVEQRQIGFLRGVMDVGGRTCDDWIVCSNSMAERLEKLRAILQNEEYPTGWIVLGPSCAFSLAEAARNNSLSIPEDLSLVAFDNPGPVTDKEGNAAYIEQPLLEIGRVAAKQFEQFALKQGERIHIAIKPFLREGNTVAQAKT